MVNKTCKIRGSVRHEASSSLSTETKSQDDSKEKENKTLNIKIKTDNPRRAQRGSSRGGGRRELGRKDGRKTPVNGSSSLQATSEGRRDEGTSPRRSQTGPPSREGGRRERVEGVEK